MAAVTRTVGRRRKMSWIPCSERFPKFNEGVEVITKDGERSIGHYAGGCWYDSINGDYIRVKTWKSH